MSKLILVRHGQANSGATDEASYDCLSDLGRQQAVWLGQYFAAQRMQFDHVVTGTLQRQIDTAESMGLAVSARDVELNEMRYFELTEAVERHFGTPAPETAQDFAHYLPQVITHWAKGSLPGVTETYAEFSDRAANIVTELLARGGVFCWSHPVVLLP